MAGRPKGARGPDYEEKRLGLLSRIRDACLSAPAKSMSLREMASAAEASVPTLKHYFSDRDGVVNAILEQAWRDAAALLSPSFDPSVSIADRVQRELDQFHLAVTSFGLDRLHVWGMNEGLGSKLSGPAYLRYFLEPTLQNAEFWLNGYREEGMIDAGVSARHAAITLYAPCLILVMHQDYLGGKDVRPADIPAFLNEHAKRFIAYVGAMT